MFGWVEICLIAAAALLVLVRVLPYLQSYRPLFRGGYALLLITAAFPRPNNPIGEFVFGKTSHGLHLPIEVFGIAWWLIGAWLFKSVLQLVLRRRFFPDIDQPQSRRLFADLATGVIYVLAFFGIVGTVFDQPVSTFLASSGVLAIVLGLALQSTLGDVLAGLAINIERPFYTGDWITLPDNMTDEVMQVNWRATRMRTWLHETVVIPNSVVTKAVMTNHSRAGGPHLYSILLGVDIGVAPAHVIDTLHTAGIGSPNTVPGTPPRAYAIAFSDSVVNYELVFAIENFAFIHGARSALIQRIASAFKSEGIPLGAPAQDVRVVRQKNFVGNDRGLPQNTAPPEPK